MRFTVSRTLSFPRKRESSTDDFRIPLQARNGNLHRQSPSESVFLSAKSKCVLILTACLAEYSMRDSNDVFTIDDLVMSDRRVLISGVRK